MGRLNTPKYIYIYIMQWIGFFVYSLSSWDCVYLWHTRWICLHVYTYTCIFIYMSYICMCYMSYLCIIYACLIILKKSAKSTKSLKIENPVFLMIWVFLTWPAFSRVFDSLGRYMSLWKSFSGGYVILWFLLDLGWNLYRIKRSSSVRCRRKTTADADMDLHGLFAWSICLHLGCFLGVFL